MNITILAAFMSTFTLIDADIDMTKRGIMHYGGGEGNPIAATFTDRGAWGELSIAAYAGNSALFLLATGIGISLMPKMAEVHPEIDSTFIVTLMQCFYILAISYAEIFAIGSWSTRGVPFDVKINPLVILW